jgi:hypothetical protein
VIVKPFILSLVRGTAEGKIVVKWVFFHFKEFEGLALTFRIQVSCFRQIVLPLQVILI